MEPKILGLHHVTAMTSDPQQNFNFYTILLGLRFIKKTVHFKNPFFYHLYYGNELGTTGTILSFLHTGNTAKKSTRDLKKVAVLGYSVPQRSMEFWVDRFKAYEIKHSEIKTKFGERYVTFFDPDGLMIELTEAKNVDFRQGRKTNVIDDRVALKGIHNVTLTLNCIGATGTILTELFGYSFVEKEGNRYRYSTTAVDSASIVDILVLEDEKKYYKSHGTIHHIAFRVQDDQALLYYRELIAELGLGVTPRIDRHYFHAIYFREPGGILFEIATDAPGFTVDESVDNLGKELKLPSAFEGRRHEIEQNLVTFHF